MAKKSAVYGNESISSLKGADRVRKRPAVIFGSDGIEGCQHSVFEILSNSIDEAREGHGNKIIMTRYADGSIEVEDFGRGIPVDYNKNEARYNWELLFCEMYAGGKYNNNSGDNYEFSLGLNGLGLCATQYAAEYMTVDIVRDGFSYHLDFEKGENVGGLQKEPTTKRQTGSKIRWKPDNTVFSDISIPESYFEEVLKRQAVVNPNVLFIFKNQRDKGFETKEYFYEKGISDYVEEICNGDNLTQIISSSEEASGKDREDMPEYKVKMNVAFAFSNKVQKIEYYHNSSFLEYGGSPEKAVKSAFVSQIDAFAKQKNLYKKNESKITFQDIEDCLVFVSSCFSTMTSYENQTKKAITNKFIAQAMTDFLKRTLEVYFIENPDEALKVVQQVIVNKQSREQAEKTRISLKKTISEKIDLANRVQKFVDCRSKDVSKREVYIVEGDSALGACKTSRDAEFQALMPVRGKILNCLKCDYDRIFKSDIITDLIKVLGCGVESPAKYQKAGIATFNIENLRWNKVVICTDADVDGFQIRTLILTMLYRLCPQLIDDGYVYIAESPLYEINTKDKTYFAYTEEEKKNILSRIEKQKFTIQRSKGLGENEPEMMWITTMNPETRRLIKVCKEDVARTQEMFELLLGDNLAGRKQYIQDFGADYLDQLDLS
ncbi:MAG: DNA topoisomerase [Ruminococcaceae bacterium]|nr:DNA topoisomerase [Oscillospiraceae bacterium]